jgi:hypothetical protein
VLPTAQSIRRAAAGTVVLALAACEGDLSPSMTEPPGVTPTASPHAGVWTGTTGQGLPASFVVADDGTVTDLAVRVKMTLAESRWCSLLFRAPAPQKVVGDQARFEIHSSQTDFAMPVELRFLAGVEATATTAGYQGAYTVDCYGDEFGGLDGLLGADTFSLRRTLSATTPPDADARLAPAEAQPLTLGDLYTGCSNQPGSDARWCAFARKAGGRTELWVVDLARVAAGPLGSACAADDRAAGCFRLSDQLWTGRPTGWPAFPRSHRFEGDTLVFFPDATWPEDEPYAGPLHVWRPGWPAARHLIDEPLDCRFARDSDAVACLAIGTGDTGQAWYAELLAGRLGDGSSPLAFVDDMLLFTAAEARLPDPPPFRFRVDLAPGGQHVLWSARPDDGPAARETLYALRLGEPPTARVQLGVDVNSWLVSRDGRAVFWLRAATFDENRAPRGPLEMASFPDATSVLTILPDATWDFAEIDARDGGPPELAVITVARTLVHVWDPADPARNSQVVDQDVHELRAWSAVGRAIAYSKIAFPSYSYWNDLHVAMLDRPALRCPIGSSPSWGGVVMSSSGAWVAAYHGTPGPENRVDLDLIRARDCARGLVARSVDGFLALPGDRFAVLSDSLPLGPSGMVSLGLLDPAIDRSFTVALTGITGQVALAPAPSGGGLDVIYSVAGGWRSDGLYHRRLRGR